MAQTNPKVGLPSSDRVITYIFDKAFHPNIKNIKKWLSLWGCSTSGIKETENNYRVKQESSSNFELGSLRTIDIADGISAVVGKIKMATKKKKRNSAVRVPNPRMHAYDKLSIEATARRLADSSKQLKDIASRNPQHFPKMKAGRPRKRGRPSKAKGKMFSRGRKAHIAWWILDLYRGTTLLTTAIGQGTKANATLEAKAMMGRHIRHKTVNKITLSGPYESKPSKDVIHSMIRR